MKAGNASKMQYFSGVISITFADMKYGSLLLLQIHPPIELLNLYHVIECHVGDSPWPSDYNA